MQRTEPTYPIKWITPAIAACYAPNSQEDLLEIRKQGISVIVNLCAECYDLADIEEKTGFNVYRLLVTDMEAPAMEDIEPALAWFENQLREGRKGLIHCRYGIGRTGTFIIAYLLRSGETYRSAMAKLKNTPVMPQSRRQWDFVEQYAKARQAALNITLPEIKAGRTNVFFKRQLDRLKWFR